MKFGINCFSNRNPTSDTSVPNGGEGKRKANTPWCMPGLRGKHPRANRVKSLGRNCNMAHILEDRYKMFYLCR